MILTVAKGTTSGTSTAAYFICDIIKCAHENYVLQRENVIYNVIQLITEHLIHLYFPKGALGLFLKKTVFHSWYLGNRVFSSD